jgi:hypothetical protein
LNLRKFRGENLDFSRGNANFQIVDGFLVVKSALKKLLRYNNLKVFLRDWCSLKDKLDVGK